MPLTRTQVVGTLSLILGKVPKVNLRLVGTASCVLRGIDMTAADIDVLFRERDAIDAWVEALQPEDAVEVETAPSWQADTSQYFARISVQRVVVELSTVELNTATDTAECFGPGPWLHHDVLRCGSQSVAAVSPELRLINELARGREDRYRPLIEFLKVTRCDLDLIRRGLSDIGATDADISRLLDELRSGPRN